MLRRVSVILALYFCCALTFARQNNDPLINYGVKAGFSSTMYEVNDLIVAGKPISDYMTRSEISLFYTAFARLNIDKHYLQTELTYNISNYTLEFATEQWSSSALPYDKSTIATKITGFEIPLYYGYHIIKEGPYGMSFFAGPKAKFILVNSSRHWFKNFPYEHITENVTPVNFSLMAGFGVNIARVFFDFSFEYGLNNISNGFTTIDLEGNEIQQGLIFNRRKNVLSFSIGFMF